GRSASRIHLRVPSRSLLEHAVHRGTAAPRSGESVPRGMAGDTLNSALDARSAIGLWRDSLVRMNETATHTAAKDRGSRRGGGIDGVVSAHRAAPGGISARCCGGPTRGPAPGAGG